ncbi:hypothetical protein [Psychrobacillus phage Perkons]|nr:hypothetical protein [Psychrobacillus phage Perkons]
MTIENCICESCNVNNAETSILSQQESFCMECYYEWEQDEITYTLEEN